MKLKVILFTLLAFTCHAGNAQITDSSLQQLKQLPEQYLNKVDKKINRVNELISKKSLRNLKKLQQQDMKISARLQLLTGGKAVENIQQKYEQLAKGLNSNSQLPQRLTGQYVGY